MMLIPIIIDSSSPDPYGRAYRPLMPWERRKQEKRYKETLAHDAEEERKKLEQGENYGKVDHELP